MYVYEYRRYTMVFEGAFAHSHIRIFVLTRAKNPRIIRVNLRKFIIITRTYSSYLLPMFTSAFESFHDCENVTNRRASHYTHIDNIKYSVNDLRLQLVGIAYNQPKLS